MEAGLIKLITDMAVSGIITDTALLLIIIAGLGILYKKVLDPMFQKIKKQPTIEDLKKIVQTASDEDELNVEEVSKKLEEMLKKLDDIEEFGKNNYREIFELKRDIEQIKTMLNQFQGHMMYNHGGTFGNRELK